MSEQQKRVRQFRRIRPKEIILDQVDDIENADSNNPNFQPNKRIVISSQPQQENARLIQILKAQRDEYQLKISKLKQQIESKQQRNDKQKIQYEIALKNDNEKIKKQELIIQQMTANEPISPDFNYENYKTDLQNKADQLSKEKEEIEIKVDQLGRSLIEAQQNLKDAKEKVKSLPQAGNIELLQKTKRQMERERDSKISFYKQQINQLNSECQKLNDILEETVQKGEALQEENKTLATTYSKLEKAVLAASNKYTKLKQQSDENGTMVTPEYAQKKLKEAEDLKMATIKKKRQELEDKYQKAKSDQIIMQQDLKDRISTVEQLNAKITSLTQNIMKYNESSQNEIKALNAQHKQNVAQLREKLRHDLENALQEQKRRMMTAMNIAKAANINN